MGALLPLLACSLMMGVVAVGFLAWYAVGAGRRSIDDRREVADLRDEIAELRHQPPAAPSEAAPRRRI